ncbi:MULTISPECIES: formylglycine-generating enzyme family protein [Sorangium]|uniref:formylglycine-generating enzyme family protein n=1 Tax=Sorangium TaxID=39643 RepID=UPI003D9C4291
MLSRRAGWWWAASVFMAGGCGTLVGLDDDYYLNSGTATGTGGDATGTGGDATGTGSDATVTGTGGEGGAGTGGSPVTTGTGGDGGSGGTATTSSGTTGGDASGGGPTSTSTSGGDASGGGPTASSSTTTTTSATTTSATTTTTSSGGGGTCTTDERRCTGNTPQRCVDDEWQSSTPCTGTMPVCIDGMCRPRCGGLAATCGPSSNENCCAALQVPGGSFNRENNPELPATVSSFEMDRFEVTVARFRMFADAYPESAPRAGAGAHPQIPGSGWNPDWDAILPASRATLSTEVRCESEFSTWTDAPGANERLPMNCTLWHIAFAFCAWDGGRLPTEAEWNYAAAGGSEQRAYPWSVPPGSMTIDGTYAAYACLGAGTGTCEFADMPPVGSRSPKGDGRWRHADLAGSMGEWTLDAFINRDHYVNPCVNCAELAEPGADLNRVVRGGGWNQDRATQFERTYHPVNDFTRYIGFRCVRTP